MTVLTETRERFLRAIVAQVPAERIAEIHFFTPLKQGGVESGVAVVAAWPDVQRPPDGEAPAEGDARGDGESVGEGDARIDGESVGEADAPPDGEAPALAEAADRRGARDDVRPVIYTARYRLTLKGPDRGKWETNVVAEADAPLVTVDAVVRGVQRRAGDVDDATRMDGDDVRAIVEAWARPVIGAPAR